MLSKGTGRMGTTASIYVIGVGRFSVTKEEFARVTGDLFTNQGYNHSRVLWITFTAVDGRTITAPASKLIFEWDGRCKDV